jgi:NAD(P)-dependent dehydrogenase (short-subunit alcohol dehydrogenase family)
MKRWRVAWVFIIFFFVSITPDAWRKVMDVNLTAVIHGTRLAMTYFTENKKPGVIVNTASLGGLYAMPFSPIYASAKHGVSSSRCWNRFLPNHLLT